MPNSTCPRCDLEIPDEHMSLDIYACACEVMIFVRPYEEWFVRYRAIQIGAQKIADADPSIVDRIEAIKRSTEN